MATIGVTGGSAAEAFSRLSFVITLSTPSEDAVTVRYRTLQGTALDDRDFNVTGERVVTFAPGETSQTVFVNMRSDQDVEPDEAVIIEVFDPINATLPTGLATLRAVGWIQDNDNLGTTRAMYVSSPVVREDDSGGRLVDFTIDLSRPFAADTTLEYTTRDGAATAGQDYVATSGVVTFFAGQTTAVVSVRVLGDRAFEGAEDFFLHVAPNDQIASGGGGATGRARILDDDTAGGGPTVTVEGGRVSESFTTLPFTVTLSEASSEAVSVKFRTLPGTAVEGVDYTRAEQTLVFAPGETSKVVNVNVRSDAVLEVDEAVVLEVFDPTNAKLGGGLRAIRETGWILEDNDNLGNRRAVFVSSPVVAESAVTDRSVAVFDVSLSRPANERITFDYATANGTARAGVDYRAASGQIVFEPGQTSASVRVEILNDALLEANETFILRLIPPFSTQIASGGVGIVGTATIVDSALLGGEGPDTLIGTIAGDAIYGGGGRDVLYGVGGDDFIYGGAGDDQLYGGLGRDRLFGGAGADLMDGGAAADRMEGGSGNDVYLVDDARDRVIEARGQGTDTVRASVDERLSDHVENLTLTGARAIDGTGNALANVLRGNDGRNRLDGGSGADALFGGRGADVLTGGRGADRLAGGAGGDDFVFRTGDSGRGRSADVIRDFARGSDDIDLARIDANTLRAGDQAFKVVGAARFDGTAGELRFQAGRLSGDVNGDGRADFEIVVEGVVRLGAADLIL